MKSTKKFENLQEALDFLSQSNWKIILKKFNLDENFDMDGTLVKLKIKSIDENGCIVTLKVS